jgi:hypothetical protein
MNPGDRVILTLQALPDRGYPPVPADRRLARALKHLLRFAGFRCLNIAPVPPTATPTAAPAAKQPADGPAPN